MANENRVMDAVVGGVFLLSIVLAIGVYLKTDSLGDALWTMMIVFGAFLAVSSVFRNMKEDGFGPSDFDTFLSGGIILAAVGAAGLIYSRTGEILYSVMVIIVVVAVVGILLAIKNRNV